MKAYRITYLLNFS